jgi:hypothetical protein
VFDRDRPRHWREGDPQTWPTPTHTTTTHTTRYGAAHARSWDRLHPKLTRTGAWAEHDGPLPLVEGTVIRLQVDRLPGTGTPKPLWLWFSDTATTAAQADRLWQMFLRRFDLEHTFRFLKQTLGWTTPPPGYLQPVSGGGFAPFDRQRLCLPARRNPPGLVLGVPQDHETPTEPRDTTPAKPRKQTPRVKRQAQAGPQKKALASTKQRMLTFCD